MCTAVYRAFQPAIVMSGAAGQNLGNGFLISISGQAVAYFKPLKILWISCRFPLPLSKPVAAAQLVSFSVAVLGKTGSGDQDPAHGFTVCIEVRVASGFVSDSQQRQTFCCFVSLMGI